MALMLSVVLCGRELVLRTLTEELKMRVFESRMLKKMFGINREEVTGGGEKYGMGSFTICTLHQVSFG
jgi:hypothetical protein